MPRPTLRILATCWIAIYCRGDSNLRRLETSGSTHVFMDSMPELKSRSDLIKKSSLHKDHVHEVIFVVQQQNMDELTAILHDVSDTESPNYGHHMSGEQITAMTMNPIARDAIVTYLHASGATVTSESLDNEFITANAPIRVWEEVLHAEFFKFQQRQIDGAIEEHIRAEEYSIPRELSEHVDCVLNTIEMPIRLTTKPVQYEVPIPAPEKQEHFAKQVNYFGYVTPPVIRNYYNMSDNHGSDSSTQAVFGGRLDYLVTKDLAKFQSLDDVYIDQPALDITGHIVSDISEVPAGSDCGEGNLDTQYIIAISHGSPTTYWSWQVSLAGWLISVADTVDPPLVLSISYGANEKYISPAEFRVFSRMAIKLGVRGITIVVASGDDGAVNFESRGDLSKCGYFPVFPASNPYVLSVGATSGPERDLKEEVCSANTTGRITSGGGFSTTYPLPKWQAATVARYFTSVAATGDTPIPGFNRSGRAYPDISAIGINYLVMYGQNWIGMAGTSASCPVVAGLISNINAARIEAGKGPVGWVTPAMYKHAAAFVNDVVVGNNKCSATAPCCPHGFMATQGWDPATGLGSINYGKMQSKFVTLGDVNSMTDPPTATPTFAPTSDPTSVPTAPPSSRTVPSRPTRKPTNRPVNRPSRRPTSTKLNSATDPTDSSDYAVTVKILVTQTLTGISLAKALTPDFVSAVEFSVITAVESSNVVVSDLTFTASNRRQLLEEDVKLMYYITLTLVEDETAAGLIAKLKESVSTGNFLKFLKTSSGLAITSVADSVVSDLSPTPTPTTAPLPPTESGGSNVSVVAITGGCIGGAFLILGAGFAYFYGIKGKKNLKKYPSNRSNSNNESGGELAFGCILTPTFSTVDMTLPPQQPKSHSGSVYDMIPNSKAEDVHATV